MPKVTRKGQVTIPRAIRELLGLKAGDSVDFVPVKDHVQVMRSPRGIDELYGSLRAYGKRMKGKSDKQVMEEVMRKVAYEAAREGLPARRKRTS
jgi:AbrB family looped-hinge helix DNA binding protein